MAALDDPVHTTPSSPDLLIELLMKLWEILPSSKPTEIDPLPYFVYYKNQCIYALHDGDQDMITTKRRDIVETADKLIQASSRQAMRDLLSLKVPVPKPTNESEVLDKSIDLTARLMSMMDFGSLQHAFSGRTGLFWDQGSLKDFIHSHFEEPLALGNEVKLDKMFTARNLERIAGMNIVWTDNLAEHLRLVDDKDKKVAIFPHISFLRYQRRPLFPPGFLEETEQTLTLLFPQTDPETARWLTKLCSSARLDRQLLECGFLGVNERQIKNFKFWHDRLVLLKEAFDESRLGTIRQWWCDSRNGVQWYTFWVAIVILILTVFFGLIQCIEGALQVYKAYYPTGATS